MRGRSTQVVAMLLVGALTVLSPGGAVTASLSSGASVGVTSAIETMAAAAPEFTGVGPAASAPPAQGTVTVTVTVVGATPPPPPPPTVIPIYRFYSPKSGTHFYAPNADERDTVIARWPEVWHYEGIAYTVNPARNTQPLYRFYNMANGSHFYTASAEEANHVIATWPDICQLEGVCFWLGQ
ncbi:MAG: hypothetical protein EG823_02185 [Actinobacteria bacterium]|nr:hypothetical protein [Actinomycetota bacterium]